MDTRELSALLGRLVERHGVPGAQLVVRENGRTHRVETGEEEYGTGRPVTADSAFPVGSLTKPYTATLAMVLVDDGDVELDEPLAGHLPELGASRPGVDSRLTLRRLLSHTGGVASNVDDSAVVATNRSRWIARNHPEADLVHVPGTVFSYSNIGYVVAGRLIEQLTGMDWREAMRSVLLEPLGTRPGFVLDEASRAGRTVASGHTVHPGSGRVHPIVDQGLPWIEEPNGGLALSAGELFDFARAHLGEHGVAAPLPPETLAQMRADQLDGIAVGPFGMADGWGLGWAIYRDTGADWFGHDGTGDGTSCHLRFEPDSGAVVAFTANAGTGLDMWDDLVLELRSLGVDVGSHPLGGSPVAVPEAADTGCAGRFVNGDTELLIARGDNGGLVATLGPEGQAELSCAEDLTFSIADPSGGATTYSGRFVRDPVSGEIDLVQLSGRVARRVPAPVA